MANHPIGAFLKKHFTAAIIYNKQSFPSSQTLSKGTDT